MNSRFIFLKTFKSATAFDQDLTPWNVDAVTTMVDMFNGATAFSQTLCWVTGVDTSTTFTGSSGSIDTTGAGKCAPSEAPSATPSISMEPSTQVSFSSSLFRSLMHYSFLTLLIFLLRYCFFFFIFLSTAFFWPIRNSFRDSFRDSFNPPFITGLSASQLLSLTAFIFSNKIFAFFFLLFLFFSRRLAHLKCHQRVLQRSHRRAHQ
jgi:hypothetical protein